MFLNFVPDAYYQNIAEIPYNTLYEQGIRLILTDLDNTLLSYKEDVVSEALLQWKKQMEEYPFEVIIVSNSRKKRVEKIAFELGIDYVDFAKKPLKSGLKKALKKAKKRYAHNQVMMLGDQLMTDIFVGKRMGFYSVLIKALDAKTEILPTKINRKLEAFVLGRIRKKDADLSDRKLKKYVEDQQHANQM